MPDIPESEAGAMKAAGIPAVVLDTPAQRIAFMQEHGAPDGFYSISAKELFAIQNGTSQLNGQISRWRTLAQALFGVSSPEEALEIAKRQKLHRQGIFDDRMRFRNALMEILTRSRKMMPDSDAAKLGDIARDAINNNKPESGT